jgi:hypothetical protein
MERKTRLHKISGWERKNLAARESRRTPGVSEDEQISKQKMTRNQKGGLVAWTNPEAHDLLVKKPDRGSRLSPRSRTQKNGKKEYRAKSVRNGDWRSQEK